MKNILILGGRKLDADRIIDEIRRRQGQPWNDGQINESEHYPAIQELFEIMNSGVPEEDFFYSGDLFRIHTSHVVPISKFNASTMEPVGRPYSHESRRVLDMTKYSRTVVSTSKSWDFTTRAFNKVVHNEKAVLFHINTKSNYGIDVQCLFRRFGYENRFADEQEVLFPLMKEFVVKEYHCTPNQFRHYFRNYRSQD